MVDFTLDNPHPGFGKDPNILNEKGHTAYPKWVGVAPNLVLVNTPKEEQEYLATLPPVTEAEKKTPVKKAEAASWKA